MGESRECVHPGPYIHVVSTARVCVCVCARGRKTKGNRCGGGAAGRKSLVCVGGTWASTRAKGVFDDDTQHRINGSPHRCRRPSAHARVNIRIHVMTSPTTTTIRRYFRRNNWPHHRPPAKTPTNIRPYQFRKIFFLRKRKEKLSTCSSRRIRIYHDAVL